MESELKSALADYLKLVNVRLGRTRDEGTDHQDLIVLRSPTQQLVSLAEKAEGSSEFARLVQATADEFSRDTSRRGSSKWRSHVQNFFRRSGVYQDTFAGTTLDTASVDPLYVDAFRRTEDKITYFAPLEFISFTEEQMNFGDFEIRRFSKDGLDRKLQQATHPAFYPWTAVDTRLLAQYWFLTCSENHRAPEPGRMFISLDFRVQPKYSRFPKPIETALKRLVLFPWGTVSQPLQPLRDFSALELWDAPSRFGVPFCIGISDSLIDRPTAMPDISVLVTVPWKDPVTGECLGERPLDGINLSEKPPYGHQKTNRDFVEFVGEANRILKDVCGLPGWHSIDIALDFLVKGFFSEGLEQLLWHITAVEAALGEKREQGLTKLLKSRVGLILGDSEEESKSSAKLFGKLYDFRSALVHGDERLTSNEANLAHLRQAGEIARCVTLWTVNYLRHIMVNRPASAVSRDDVLAALDVNPQTRPAVATILSRLPPGFPQIPEWRGG
jgi:hypothetical protein